MRADDRTHILIAEDESKIAAVLKDYLEQAGYRAHCLARGDEVVPWVKDNAPEALLLVVMLPGMDGMEVCRTVRAFSSVLGASS